MNIAARVKQLGRKDMVLGLGFLQAKDVRLLVVEDALDDRHASADRVDVPGSTLERGHGILSEPKT